LKSHILIFTLFLFFAQSFKSQEKKGPVAKFSFNDRIDYNEINKQKIKLVGVDYTEDRFGNPASSVYFSSHEFSYVNLGTDKILKPKKGSISLWVKLEHVAYAGQGSTINPFIITKCADREDYNEAYALHFGMESERICVAGSRDSLKQVAIYSMTKFQRFVWHHLVICYDFDFLYLYIDNKLEGKVAKKYETQFNPLDSVMLGSTASKKNARFFNGLIDDVEFYDRILTAQEINDIYNAPNPNKYKLFLNWLLLGLCFLVFVAGIYYFIKYRLKLILLKEKQQLELHNTMLETELRVNRALMNPHFVFNSMNALQTFILKNENERANNYLVKFSKLMRKILENNMSESISLEMEIDLLQKYLEIEDLRFDENIIHHIHVNPSIRTATIKIPIMMIQPFIENAIWHGLLKKPGTKTLDVSFFIQDETYLKCVVEDNGTGRKKNSHSDLEKKSLGISFVQQRLELFNKIYNLSCSLIIEDKPNNTGTIVIIDLPILK